MTNKVGREDIMKQRLITAAIGLMFLAVVLYFMYTPFFVIVFSALCAIAAYEIMSAAKVENKGIMILALAFAAAFPIFTVIKRFTMYIYLIILIFYIVLQLLIMLLNFETTRFEHVAIALFASLIVPFGFSSIIYLRDVYTIYPSMFTKRDGIFLIVMALLCAWITDSGAYFVGRKFGKHKLCPKISPHKTVEGAVGGVVACVIVNMIVLFAFRKTVVLHFSYLTVLPLSIVLSLLSMCGDLSASTIKRNYGVKDFGNIMPGHGGIMDRCDSLLFVAPILYAFVYLMPIIVH